MIKQALEEATAAHLQTLDGMPEKRDRKIRSTIVGTAFWVVSLATFVVGLVIAWKGAHVMGTALICLAFYGATIGSNAISGEMADALKKSNPVLGGLLKIITGRLK